MSREQPLLLVDVDDVISLFEFERIHGRLEMIDGFPHHLSLEAAAVLREIAPLFECVWCTGWEERAEEHLPHLLGLAGGWPYLHFDRARGPGQTTAGHWKLDAIDEFAGDDRALAWVDDAHDAACSRWASARSGPTVLVTTDAAVGITAAHATALAAWADALAADRRTPP